MEISEYYSITELKPCFRTFAAGDYLFKQGQSGNTMFIILSGEVELLAERDDVEVLEAVLAGGQFLGEKAIVTELAHQRLFSARARRTTDALEVSSKDIDRLQQKAPHVVSDMLRRSFVVSGERLSRMNYLVRILRPSDNDQRLVACIRYFCRALGKRTDQGVEITLPLASIHYYIDMDLLTIRAELVRLDAAGLVKAQGKDRYLVPDENALLEASSLRMKAA